MLIYLDTCAVQRPLDDPSQLRIRVEADILLAIVGAAESNELDLASSDVLRFETENNPIPARRDFARRVLALATADTATTPEVAEWAKRYEQAGMKPLDAVHLASAVAVEADFFCTVDDSFLSKARTANTGPTRVVSPVELMTEIAP